MKSFRYPDQSKWLKLSQRPTFDFSELEASVMEIMSTVRSKGDQAILDYGAKFDSVNLTSIAVDLSKQELEIDPLLASSIEIAKNNIESFHTAQKEDFGKIDTMEGVTCWRKSIPIQNVGLYIPGGTAPLFSTLLMLAIPAQIAGCENIVVCTPPQKDGRINPVIGYTCKMLGIQNAFLTGGAQAVGAMTFGTESVPAVDKIFGPGNQYVTAAKQLAQKFGVAIDMPAGPSEVLVIADERANPTFVAADLLSQAEHGVDSQVVLVSNSVETIAATERELETQLSELPRKEMAAKALENSCSILVESLEEAVAFSNVYGPEHLIISTSNAEELGEKIKVAGSVFLGSWSCESAGDYASGTNHTLPTNGYARNYSGVSLDSFVNKVTFQKLSEKGIQNLGPAIERMAEAEQLQAHKNAVTVRLRYLNDLPPAHSEKVGELPISPLEGAGSNKPKHP